MKVYDKLKWILGILMIFVLIITTNLIDKNNFIRVKESVVTIYEDRLLANDIIFDIIELIHEKELTLTETSYPEQEKSRNKQLQLLATKFSQTKLTSEEAKIFSEFNNHLDLLLKDESNLNSAQAEDTSKILKSITLLKRNLHDLSKIQLNEGNRQMSIINRAVDTVELFTQIEIYMLVFLAVLVQIIVMYKPKE